MKTYDSGVIYSRDTFEQACTNWSEGKSGRGCMCVALKIKVNTGDRWIDKSKI